ncbi:MAG TPA: hypothetical protein VK002_02625 [Rubricoccaceae bacterium]|nr:hypothetical protein [Rubricoccaceae bacterium]
MATVLDPGRSDAGRRGALTPARALVLYVVYVLAFVFGGGLGAGIPGWIFNAATGEDIDSDPNFILYAIMFGVTGWIAYKLAQRVMEGYERP